MQAIYTLGIWLYGKLILVASLWNKDARVWRQGRKRNLDSLKIFRQKNEGELVWIHCASHGEYEQGLPLIQMIKRKQPSVSIALTFFSPSGYNAVREKAPVDWIGYIPLDVKSTIGSFLTVLKPSKAIFVKNEWWWNSLSCLIHHNIPVHFVSSTVRTDHYFVKYKLSFIMAILRSVDSYGVIDSTSAGAIKTIINPSKVYTSGDMRVDRVQSIANNYEDKNSNLTLDKVIIYGSVWKEDIPSIRLLMQEYADHIHILFPHKIDDKHVSDLKQVLHGSTITFDLAEITKKGAYIFPVMGKLSSTYRHADIAYIGGGHGVGIHNTLEAAVYGIPLFSGPNIEKSKEALELQSLGLLHLIAGTELPTELPMLNLKKIKSASSKYFDRSKGGTAVTYNYIFGDQ